MSKYQITSNVSYDEDRYNINSSGSDDAYDHSFLINSNVSDDENSDLWIIYYKAGCPWCEKAEQFLIKNNFKPKMIDGVNNEKLKSLMKKQGHENYTYWPKIFLNGVFFGGYSDLEKKFKRKK
jgi:glutaredoxin